MIRSHFGLKAIPFDPARIDLLEHQQSILEMLMVHAQQGGLCLVLGEPGTGKSAVKQALIDRDPKRMVTPVVNRTLHTYSNTLRILCDAFQVEYDGARDCKAERNVVEQAFKLHRAGKMIVPIIDDVHLMPAESLRKLRLLFEDFPRSHNLVLFGQPTLLHTLSLVVNEEIRSRVTFSVVLKKLAPEDIEKFLLDQLERAGLGRNVFTEEAVALIVRSADGLLRRARNLAIGSLVEAVRDQTRTVEIKQVNHVLAQPHWRDAHDLKPM
jgi:type II secretory pathway predicted ATPase ExeA